MAQRTLLTPCQIKVNVVICIVAPAPLNSCHEAISPFAERELYAAVIRKCRPGSKSQMEIQKKKKNRETPDTSYHAIMCLVGVLDGREEEDQRLATLGILLPGID